MRFGKSPSHSTFPTGEGSGTYLAAERSPVRNRLEALAAHASVPFRPPATFPQVHVATGLLYAGDAARRSEANDEFSAINQTGDIT